MKPRGSLSHEPFDSPTVIGPIVAPGTPEEDTAPRGMYRELDGQRGIAVLALVVFHVYQYCNTEHFLYFGTFAYTLLDSLDAMVPWFFVIIAFLLFEPFARSAVDGGGGVSGRAFLSRRAVRVLPLYYFAILVVWFTRQQTLPGDWHDLLEHLTFTQVFDSKRIFYTIGPAWSISVTVFFYGAMLVLTLGLSRICRRLQDRKRRIMAVALGVCSLAAVSLTWKAVAFAVLHQSTTGSPTTWFGPLANLDNFAVGMFVALFVAMRGDLRPLEPRRRLALRITGLLILAAAFLTRTADTWPAVYFSTACAIGFGCLVAAAVLGAPGDLWARTLSRRPLLWLGVASYSIYLWHEPIMLALGEGDGLIRQAPAAFLPDALVVLAASILVGGLSYVLIERPTSRLRGVFGAIEYHAESVRREGTRSSGAPSQRLGVKTRER